jgi:hypothetical protein
MTSGMPDTLLHRLRAAVVAGVHTDNDLTLRQKAVARFWGQSAHVPDADAHSQNPHPRHSLVWLTWIIARLGGWACYDKPSNHRPCTPDGRSSLLWPPVPGLPPPSKLRES